MGKERDTSMKEAGPKSKEDNEDQLQRQNQKANEDINNLRSHAEGGANKPRAKVEESTPESNKVTKPHLRDNATFDWRAVGPWKIPPVSDKMEALETSKHMQAYVYDHLYGDWFWNCSLMMGTCLFAYFIARIGFGVFSLVIVLLFTNSVYRTEFRRFNRDIRDDMTRLAANNRLENELESMEWLNSFLDKFWVIYMPALTEMVIFQTNEIMRDQAPGFGIEAISLDEFTLGSKAPRINSVKTYPSKGHDHIEMDWDFSFAPNDTDDMTKREIKKMIKPKVALGVTVGKAFISKTLPILVEDMSMTGRLNIKLKLTQNFPHVKTVSVQFLEAPTIDYALKPVGGDAFGIDIMSFIPGLSSFVNGIIHSTLRPMVYAPNSFDIDIEDLMEQQSNDSIGVLALTIKKCTKLKTGVNTKPNSINPYVQVQIFNNPKVDERTKAKKEINDPVFIETKFILVNQLQANHIILNVYDLIKDKAEDQIIGSTSFPMDELLQEEIKTDLVKNLTESGKTVGKIEFDIRYYPTLPPIIHEDGVKEAVTDTEVGIVKVVLHEAKNLDISKSVIGVLNPYAEIFVNHEQIKDCRKLRGTNEPSWEESFESLITEQSTTSVQVVIKDAVDDRIVGQIDANLQDLLFETSRGQQWLQAQPLNGTVPKVRITATWKALPIDDELNAGSYTPPIGGIRIHIRSAKGLKNLESVGVIDPYVRVSLHGKLRGRTQTIADTVDPFFNSLFYLPVGNEHQHYLLELMDEEEGGKDRSLGTAAINVFEFMKKNDEGFYIGYDGAEEIIEQPVLFYGVEEGTLSYSVSFVPNIPLMSIAQRKNRLAYLEELQEKEDRFNAKRAEDEKLLAENPDDYEWIDIEDNSHVEAERIELPLDKVIEYRSGSMVVHVNHARFEKSDLFLQILFDEHGSPSGVSSMATGKVLATKFITEAFIRDLPNSNIIFRLTKTAEIGKPKHVVFEKQLLTLDLLEKSHYRPYVLNLSTDNNAEIQMEFFPTATKLEPLDTILNVGKLKLNIMKAEDLKSVDSNGKSDPLCVIKIDGVEVYKTDKKRKTLNPSWNESCEIPLLSRSTQIVLVEVYDWDYTHDDELLGRAYLDFSRMTALEDTPFEVELDTQGRVFLQGMFFPEYIRPKLILKGAAVDKLAFQEKKSVGLKTIGHVGSTGLGAGVGGVSAVIDVGEHLFSKIKHIGSKTEDEPENNGEDDIKDEGDYANKPKAEIGATEDEKKVQEEQERKNKSIFHRSKKTINRKGDETDAQDAQPNIVLENLPEPQFPGSNLSARPGIVKGLTGGFTKPSGAIMGHSRNASMMSGSVISDQSSIYSTANNGFIPGRLSIVSAKGFRGVKSLEIKVVLKTSFKDKNLYKTRSTKGNGDIFSINESVAFRSNAESELHFFVRDRHSFGKRVEVGHGVLPLSQAIDRESYTVEAGAGQVIVGLRYHNVLEK